MHQEIIVQCPGLSQLLPYCENYHLHSPAKKNGTLISQQQIIPIIPILMYFDQEAMIANITLSISIGYFISIKTNFLLKNLLFLNLPFL
jgi:hypothetical protein